MALFGSSIAAGGAFGTRRGGGGRERRGVGRPSASSPADEHPPRRSRRRSPCRRGAPRAIRWITRLQTRREGGRGRRALPTRRREKRRKHAARGARARAAARATSPEARKGSDVSLGAPPYSGTKSNESTDQETASEATPAAPTSRELGSQPSALRPPPAPGAAPLPPSPFSFQLPNAPTLAFSSRLPPFPPRALRPRLCMARVESALIRGTDRRGVSTSYEAK